MTRRPRVAYMMAALALLVPIAPAVPQTAPPSPPNPVAPPAIPMPTIPAMPTPPKPPVMSPPAVQAETAAPSKPAEAAQPGRAGTGKAANGKSANGQPAERRAAAETAGFLSLLGLGDDNPLLRGVAGSSGSGTKSSTDALLERLIEKMDSGSGSSAAPTAPAATTQSRPAASERAEAAVEVLRCVVNGHDLERGFSSGFVSTRAGDGSFLVTGERYLVLEGVRRRELVYLLYRPGSGNAGFLYVDVSQEVPNGESFFRRLSLSGPIPATAIGDLVVCRASREDLVADFLFRSRVPSVRPGPGR